MFICLGGCFIFAYATTAKIRLTLHLLFPIFIVGQIVFCSLSHNSSHRFSKDVNHFTINDLVEAKPTNAFAEAVGGESIRPSIEGSGNEVVINLLVSFCRVRTILQPINRIGELSELGVCDCQFDFL